MSVDFPKPEDLDAREAELKTVLECTAAILHKDDRARESPFDLIGRGLQLQHEIFQTYLGMILPQLVEMREEVDKLIAKEEERSAKIKEMEDVKARIQKLAARLAKPPL
jgi:hypothetical protein